jgi:hypothetical protein
MRGRLTVFRRINAQEGREQRHVCWQGTTPPNGHNHFTRAGESQLSSFELSTTRRQGHDWHPWHSKLGRPNSKLFWNMRDINRSADEQTRPPLALFHFLRQLAKLLGLLVARLYLHLCKLSRFFTRQKQNQRFKLSCRVVSVVGLCLHQAFKFPQCLVVIHISSHPLSPEYIPWSGWE